MSDAVYSTVFWWPGELNPATFFLKKKIQSFCLQPEGMAEGDVSKGSLWRCASTLRTTKARGVKANQYGENNVCSKR